MLTKYKPVKIYYHLTRPPSLNQLLCHEYRKKSSKALIATLKLIFLANLYLTYKISKHNKIESMPKRIFFVTMESDMVWNLLCCTHKRILRVSSSKIYSESWESSSRILDHTTHHLLKKILHLKRVTV
jgi:hypothetical protein